MTKTISNEIEELNKKAEEVSIAVMSIKSANKSKVFWFVAWLITFLFLLAALVYICYLHDDIDTETTESIEIQDVEQINSSHIKIGDDVWEELY